MGSMGSKYPGPTPPNSPTFNRYPIISPRHVPSNIPYDKTPYSKFDPALTKDKFSYPEKEPPKYW